MFFTLHESGKSKEATDDDDDEIFVQLGRSNIRDHAGLQLRPPAEPYCHSAPRLGNLQTQKLALKGAFAASSTSALHNWICWRFFHILQR